MAGAADKGRRGRPGTATFGTPLGPIEISRQSREWLVTLLRGEGWTPEVEAIEAARDARPIELDRVGAKAIFSILVGFAEVPADLAALRDALANA